MRRCPLSFRPLFILLVVIVFRVGTVEAQEAQDDNKQYPQPLSQLQIEFYRRNADYEKGTKSAAEYPVHPLRCEVWEDESGPYVMREDYGYYGNLPYPQKDNEPVLFIQYAPELERPIMSYTAWNRNSDYTYAASGVGEGPLLTQYQLSPCPEGGAAQATIGTRVFDSFDRPCIYKDEMLDYVDLQTTYTLSFHPGNIGFEDGPIMVGETRPRGVIIEVGDVVLAPINPPVDYYYYFDRKTPVGLGDIRVEVDGYQSFPLELGFHQCDRIKYTAYLAPSYSSGFSPVDELPSDDFPFPPPDWFIEKARREVILGQAVVFGYLERALNPEWDLTFGATTPYAGGTKEFVEADVVYTIDGPSTLHPGETAELVLSATAPADVKAFNATLEIDGITSGTEVLIPVEVLPGEAFQDAHFASHQQRLFGGAYEVRAYGYLEGAMNVLGLEPESLEESDSSRQGQDNPSPGLQSGDPDQPSDRTPAGVPQGESGHSVGPLPGSDPVYTTNPGLKSGATVVTPLPRRNGLAEEASVSLLRVRLTIPKDFPAPANITARLKTEIDYNIALTSLADSEDRLYSMEEGGYTPHAPTELAIPVRNSVGGTGWVVE